MTDRKWKSKNRQYPFKNDAKRKTLKIQLGKF